MAPWPGRLSSVTQITIATDEAVVVVEWSLSGRKLFPWPINPRKDGVVGRFLGKRFPRQGPAWSTHEFGCRQNNVHRPTVAGQAEGEGYLARYHVHDHKICGIFLDLIFQKQTTSSPTQTFPQVSQVTRLTRRCPHHPPPPATTCHLPLLSTFTRIISQAPPSAPPLQRAAPRTTTTTANHPTQAPHTIFFSNDTTTRDSPIARRVSHRRRRHPTSRATQSRQADPIA